MTRVLTGATLIDGTGAAPVPDAAVVIDGDRITAAGGGDGDGVGDLLALGRGVGRAGAEHQPRLRRQLVGGIAWLLLGRPSAPASSLPYNGNQGVPAAYDRPGRAQAA